MLLHKLLIPSFYLICTARAAAVPNFLEQGILAPALPFAYEEPVPIDNSTWSKAKHLFKRSCHFQDDASNNCAGNGALCCYNLANNKGFCCGGNYGGCCGNSCCAKNYHCAYADETRSSCCPNGQTCAGFQPATVTKNNYVTDTALITTTDLQTATQTATQTQRVTQMITSVQTTTDSSGRTLMQSTTLAVTANAAGIASAGATSTASNPSSSSSTPVGAIVGGVVGGVAFLALLGALLFIGTRKGWFDKKQPAAPPTAAGTAMPSEYKSSPPMQESQLYQRNTVSPVPPYDRSPQEPRYSTFSGNSQELAGRQPPMANYNEVPGDHNWR